MPFCIEMFVWLVGWAVVCLFDLILSSHQQSFSYKGAGLPGLNQY